MELNLQSILNLDLDDVSIDQIIQNYQNKVSDELGILNKMLNLQNTVKNAINVN